MSDTGGGLRRVPNWRGQYSTLQAEVKQNFIDETHGGEFQAGQNALVLTASCLDSRHQRCARDGEDNRHAALIRASIACRYWAAAMCKVDRFLSLPTLPPAPPRTIHVHVPILADCGRLPARAMHNTTMIREAALTYDEAYRAAGHIDLVDAEEADPHWLTRHDS